GALPEPRKAGRHLAGPQDGKVSRIFKHSRWDAASIATLPNALAIQFYIAHVFGQLGPVGLVAALVAMYLSDKAGVRTRHNFFHTPFFSSRRLNQTARWLFAATSTMPPSAYAIGHNTHHRYTIAFNDFRLRDALGVSSFRRFVRSFMAVLDPFALRNIVLLVYLYRRSGTDEAGAGERRPFPERFGSHQEYNGYLFGEVLRRLSRDRALLRQVALEGTLGMFGGIRPAR